MAEANSTGVIDNEPIMKAVEYLKMVPIWKESPGKLRRGHVEFSQALARQLTFIYSKLEGKDLAECIELHDSIDPVAEERDELRKEHTQGNRIADYRRSLDGWHLQLAMLRDLVDHILTELDGPEWMTSAAGSCQHRFLELIETMPMLTDTGVAPAMTRTA